MTFQDVLNRITIDFLQFTLSEQLLIFLIIGLLPKIYSIIYHKKLDDSISSDANTILILFLSMNLMTISLSSYNPTCLDMRHFLFCVPICIVSSANIIYYFSQKLTSAKKRLLTIMLSLMMIPSIKYALNSKTLSYPENKADFIKLIEIAKKEEVIIVSNQVMTNFLRFYSQYSNDEKFKSIDELNNITLDDKFLIATNWYTEFHSNSSLTEICHSLNIELNQMLIVQNLSNQLNTIQLYCTDQALPNQ